MVQCCLSTGRFYQSILNQMDPDQAAVDFPHPAADECFHSPQPNLHGLHGIHMVRVYAYPVGGSARRRLLCECLQHGLH